MDLVSSIAFGIILLYAVAILLLAYGFAKVPVFKSEGLLPKTNFSIIVPFRNEAANLPELMYSFSQLNYPRNLYEIIFVNDGSEDNSLEIIKNFPMRNANWRCIDSLRKTGSPKKDAIATAIKDSTNEWVVTTDADCFVNQNWLKELDNLIQNSEVQMVAGPVLFTSGASFLAQFQQMDLMSLQGATIGSFGLKKPFMCNGANLAYTKELFITLNGFDGNSEMASGDDVFLLQKAIQERGVGPEKIAYLKSEEAVVVSKSLASWQEVFYQRVRWASKTSAYNSGFGKLLALIVFAGNCTVVFASLLLLFGLFSFWNWYLLFALKISTDFAILYQTGHFLKPEKVKFFLLINLFYPFFSTAVAVYTLFGTYEWKGRRFQQ